MCLLVAGGTVGGFFAGRYSNHDAYVSKALPLILSENTMTSLYSVIGSQLADPIEARAYGQLYGVSGDDRDALTRRLQAVAWVPAYQPAPVVGNIARPQLGDEPHINLLGFRDERQGYVIKAPRTVRIFLTGGSTAWGSGASSQKQTISYLLEHLINTQMSRKTGYRYEVINTAFPAWTTTQEKLLIEQRLVDMHPDVVLMFSGNNDIHWTREGRDIRWFHSPMDDNHMLLLNELYRSSGHPEWTFPAPSLSSPLDCAGLARISARNVEDAAIATGRVKAHLIFALQPNVATTSKRLSVREQRLAEVPNKPYWESCYRAMRAELSRVGAPNYRLIDLSRAFGELDDRTELFVDSYHVADLGNRLIAQALAARIDWRSIVPNAAATGGGKPLEIVIFDRSPSLRPDGTATLRIVPSRFNPNLRVVFDSSVLPTVVAADALTAAVPASLGAAKGEHHVYVVDGMTGEASRAVAVVAR